MTVQVVVGTGIALEDSRARAVHDASGNEGSGAKTRGGSPAGDQAMNRYADGDDGAFADVYDALAPDLHDMLLEHVSRAQADELLVEVMLYLHRNRGTFIRGSSGYEWAKATALRFVSSRHR